MSLAEAIIQAMDKPRNDDLGILRGKMKSKRPLSKVDFRALVKLLEKKALEVLSTEDLSVHECLMIGKALMASKLCNMDEIIEFVVTLDSKRTPTILNCLLNKNCKIDTSPVKRYLDRMICREIHLCHLKILLTVSKNYPSLISPQILDFCGSNGHLVCKEILNRHKIEVLD